MLAEKRIEPLGCYKDTSIDELAAVLTIHTVASVVCQNSSGFEGMDCQTALQDCLSHPDSIYSSTHNTPSIPRSFPAGVQPLCARTLQIRASIYAYLHLPLADCHLQLDTSMLYLVYILLPRSRSHCLCNEQSSAVP